MPPFGGRVRVPALTGTQGQLTRLEVPDLNAVVEGVEIVRRIIDRGAR